MSQIQILAWQQILVNHVIKIALSCDLRSLAELYQKIWLDIDAEIKLAGSFDAVRYDGEVTDLSILANQQLALARIVRATPRDIGAYQFLMKEYARMWFSMNRRIQELSFPDIGIVKERKSRRIYGNRSTVSS